MDIVPANLSVLLTEFPQTSTRGSPAVGSLTGLSYTRSSLFVDRGSPPTTHYDRLAQWRASRSLCFPAGPTNVPTVGRNVCQFLGSSSVGRAYRSRSPENVPSELAHQHEKHGAALFVFADRKLHSNVHLWRELIDRIQKLAPGSKWIGSVHVSARANDGLSLGEPKRARAAGMVRVTTGLEAGSQAVLAKMAKGTDLENASQFLHEAKAADLSVQTTMMTGYPRETVDVLNLTTRIIKQRWSESK